MTKLLADLAVATSGKTEPNKAEIYQRHLARFMGMKLNLGDEVVFKRPKRNKQVWTFVGIELDVNEVKWSRGGERPNYIQLATVFTNKKGEQQTIECWTCENQFTVRKRYAQADSH